MSRSLAALRPSMKPSVDTFGQRSHICFELICSHTVPKGFDAVDEQDWYFKLIPGEQVRLAFDVDFFQRIEFGAAGAAHNFLHLFTKIAAGPGVQSYLRS